MKPDLVSRRQIVAEETSRMTFRERLAGWLCGGAIVEARTRHRISNYWVQTLVHEIERCGTKNCTSKKKVTE